MKNSKHLQAILKLIGSRIQGERKKQKLSQQQLATKVGVSRVYIGYIEQGRESPSLRTVIKISEVLKMKLDKLFAN